MQFKILTVFWICYRLHCFKVLFILKFFIGGAAFPSDEAWGSEDSWSYSWRWTGNRKTHILTLYLTLRLVRLSHYQLSCHYWSIVEDEVFTTKRCTAAMCHLLFMMANFADFKDYIHICSLAALMAGLNLFLFCILSIWLK